MVSTGTMLERRAAAATANADTLIAAAQRLRREVAKTLMIRTIADAPRLELYQVLTTLLTSTLVAVPSFARAQDTAYAFVHVAVIPMDSDDAHVRRDQTVVVRGGHIAALGPAATVTVPVGAKRIDGRGKFLIPGLADMHAHTRDTTGATFAAYVANGITAIRIMGYVDLWALTLRERAAKGELLSPRLYVGKGPPDGIGGLVGDVLEWDWEEAVAFVKQAKAEGFDFVKVYGGDGPGLDSAAATARRLGIPLEGHAPTRRVMRAIDAGYASMEHLFGIETLLGGPISWWLFWGRGDTLLTAQDAQRMVTDSANMAKLRRLVAAAKQAGVWTCPTLAMYVLPSFKAETWPEMRYVRPEALQEWQQGQTDDTTSDVEQAARAAVAARGVVVKTFRDMGAGLLLGTDGGSSVPFMVAGFSVHHELEALVQAGLTPYEALATGTRNVAQFLGARDSTGTVAVGKRADLVLLAGNPLEDIRNTMRPAGVMLAGRWLDRAELDRDLAALEGKLN